MIADISSQPQEPEARKRKRGETREDGKVFLKYKRGKEQWVTPEKLAEVRAKESANAKILRHKDPEKARERSRASHAKNKEKEREYYQKNKERILARNKEWSSDNRGRHRELTRKWAAENPDKMSAYSRKHKISDKGKDYMREYVKMRRREIPKVAMAERIRARIKTALKGKGYGKDQLSSEILGCSWEEFAAHLESQFSGGISWDNRDEWHVDHIIPIAAASDLVEVKMLNHYTNLQPMWGSDNLKKSDTLPPFFVDKWNALCKITGNELKMR